MAQGAGTVVSDAIYKPWRRAAPDDQFGRMSVGGRQSVLGREDQFWPAGHDSVVR
jgi:hypothetical protein